MIFQPLYCSLKLYSNLCPRKLRVLCYFAAPFACCIVESSFDHSVGVVGLAGFATRTNTLCKALQIQLHDTYPTVHFNFNKDLHLGKTYCWRYKTQRSQTMPVDTVSEIPHPLAFQVRFVDECKTSLTKALYSKILNIFGYLYVIKWNKLLSNKDNLQRHFERKYNFHLFGAAALQVQLF